MSLPSTTLHLIEEVVSIAGLLLVLYLVRSLIESRFRPSEKTLGYVLNTNLTSPAEKLFLDSLDSVLPAEIRVLIKVRLADLFSVENSNDRVVWKSAFNRIQSKHVDFLLCRSDNLAPLAAIELDDKSHDRQDRQDRDKFLNELFATSRIKLIRIKAQRSYDTGELARMLTEAIQATS